MIKPINFEGLRIVGNPNEFASKYYKEGIDEIIFMDTVATLYGRNHLSKIILNTTKDIFVPITVGGGIRSIPNIRKMLESGADKVSLNTSAILNMKLIPDASDHFGCQCIVVAMDAKQAGDRWEVYTHGGRKPTGIDALAWAKRMADSGAGEILLTSMDRDGTRDGFDLALTRAVVDTVTIPVIASGGVGTLEHLAAGILEGGANAVLAASIFHFGEFTIDQAKQHMAMQGIEVNR